MKTVRYSKGGAGIVEKIIAIVILIVTIVAMVVIAKMPSEKLISLMPIAVRDKFNSLEKAKLKKEIDENGESVETSTKPAVQPKASDANEARRERAETYLETALLEVTTKNIKEEKVINYNVEVLKTVELNKGDKKVTQKGQNGLKETNKSLTYKGEQLKETEVTGSKTVKKAVNEIVLEGVESSVPVFMVPAKGRYSSYYGERWEKMHKGIDIAAPIGTDIKASEGGEVIFSGDKGTYGNCIIIKHKNGYETVYAHISKLIAKKGQKVDKGETIAEVGNTGRSTGPHLHFEVKTEGKQIDPMKYLKSNP